MSSSGVNGALAKIHADTIDDLRSDISAIGRVDVVAEIVRCQHVWAEWNAVRWPDEELHRAKEVAQEFLAGVTSALRPCAVCNEQRDREILFEYYRARYRVRVAKHRLRRVPKSERKSSQIHRELAGEVGLSEGDVATFFLGDRAEKIGPMRWGEKAWALHLICDRYGLKPERLRKIVASQRKRVRSNRGASAEGGRRVDV